MPARVGFPFTGAFAASLAIFGGGPSSCFGSAAALGGALGGGVDGSFGTAFGGGVSSSFGMAFGGGPSGGLGPAAAAWVFGLVSISTGGAGPCFGGGVSGCVGLCDNNARPLP